MKHYKYFSPKFLVVPFLLGVVVYFGCSKDRIQSMSDGTILRTPSILRSLLTDQILEMHYDVETFTRVYPQGQTNARIDALTAEPVVGKQRVTMSLNNSGNVNMEMENMTPGINLNVINNNLPSNLPAPHRSVFENGRLTLYSETGRELYSTPAEPFRASDLVNVVAQAKRMERSPEIINEAILSMLAQNYRAKLDSMLTYPTLFGVTVNYLTANAVSIRMPVSTGGTDQSDGYVVLLVDRQRNLLLGSKNYKGNGEVQMCMMIRYDDGTVPTIKAIRQEIMETLPSGAQAMVEMVSTFSNLQLTIY